MSRSTRYTFVAVLKEGVAAEVVGHPPAEADVEVAQGRCFGHVDGRVGGGQNDGVPASTTTRATTPSFRIEGRPEFADFESGQAGADALAREPGRVTEADAPGACAPEIRSIEGWRTRRGDRREPAK